MKKSYIAPEIKTMIIDNVVMAATSGETTTNTFSLGSKDNYTPIRDNRVFNTI